VIFWAIFSVVAPTRISAVSAFAQISVPEALSDNGRTKSNIKPMGMRAF
jgi:hypothetical protein